MSPGEPESATQAFPLPSMASPSPVSDALPPPLNPLAELKGAPLNASSLKVLLLLRTHAFPYGSTAICRGESKPPPLNPPPVLEVFPVANGDRADPVLDNSV